MGSWDTPPCQGQPGGGTVKLLSLPTTLEFRRVVFLVFFLRSYLPPVIFFPALGMAIHHSKNSAEKKKKKKELVKQAMVL